MKINFPRGIIIDTNKIPEDFEEIIRKSFEEYTAGTSKAYTYQDKLAYIDLCRKLLHKAGDAQGCVLELMKERLEYEVCECGSIPDKEDYLSTEFMEQCFESGRTNLYAHYTGDHHEDDKIMELLVRAIKVVINYEREEL